MNTFLSAFVNGLVLSFPLTIAAGLALRLTPRSRLNAATRYVILWGALLLSALLPEFYLPHRAAHVMPHPTAIASHAAPISAGVFHAALQHTFDAEPDAPPSRSHSPILPITIPAGNWTIVLSLVWAIAALFMLLRLLVSWILLERRKSQGLAPTEQVARRAEGWLAQCGSKRKARLYLTETEIPSPIATGPWRASIVFPARIFEDFDDAAIDQIGLHEAAHLARRDDYALTLQRLIEAIFVFHLPIRYLANQIGLEREIACDDFVVQITGLARDYASCLTRVAENAAGMRPGFGRKTLIAAAVADESSHLSTRVEMLLSKTRSTGTRLMRLPLCAGSAIAMMLAGAVPDIPLLLNFATPATVAAQTPAPSTRPGVPAYVTP